MTGRLRALDDFAMRRPRHFAVMAVASTGLAYGLLGGAWWLWVGLLSADGGSRAAVLVTFPWSALPLMLVLTGARPRPVAVTVLVGALTQLLLVLAAGGAWGLELAYLPIAAVALLLLVIGRPDQR